MQLEVDLQYACKQEVPAKKAIKHWVFAALVAADQQRDAEITVRFVTIDEIQQLNNEYRGKDIPTNILSFPFDIPPGLKREDVGGFLGDLVICADIVLEEAKRQGKQTEAHWAHMLIHGTLHLVGFDHINSKKATQMETIEIDLLSELGYANPYEIF